MGTVWLAEHVTLGRRVALKILAHGLADDPSFQDRFMREARLAARLDHPNVVPVYDAGADPAGLWLSMRYVEGEDLRRRLDRLARSRETPSGDTDPDGTLVLGSPGGLPPEEAVAIVEGVAAGLDHAHGRGILHRDVKPGNVLLEFPPRTPDRPVRGAGGTTEHPVLTPWRRVLLADFGLTKELDGQHDLTQTGMLLGSTDAMAPEQIEGHAVDARVDVYALASLFYVALTGEPPFSGPPMAKLFAHVNGERPRVSDVVPALSAFDAVIATGMARDPDDRPASAGALAELARAALGGGAGDAQATVAMPAPVVPRTPPRPTPPAGTPRAPRLREDPTRVEPVVAQRAAHPGRPRDEDPYDEPPYEDPQDERRGTPPWLLPALVVAALLVAVVVVGALALGGGSGDDPQADAATTTERERETTTERAPTTTEAATTEEPPATTEQAPPTTTAEDPDPAGDDVSVAGGGTLVAGDAANDPAAGTPLAGDGVAATYAAPDGTWTTLLARPSDDWDAPERTQQSGGALARLRQSGPDDRLILVDHTPDQAATFDTAAGVLETRQVSGTAFGAPSGYRFKDARIASIPECETLQCVDIPLNASEDGPGWGVLVAAPTAEEAWATATRVARATRQSG
jgi:serine/threonine-protein kinase